jgi:chromate transport protein ChrA
MSDPMNTSDLAVAVLLSEYDALKAEQRSRIGFRDQLLYAVLTAAAAIAAVTATAARLELLLVLPLAGVVLGWTHLHNDHMISEIGRYVRDRLGPRLHALTHHDGSDAGDAGDLPMFEWESDRNADRRRVSRKWLQLAVNLAAFCLPPLAALIIVWAAGPHTPAVLAVSVLEAAALAVLALQITRYADLASTRQVTR